MFCLILEPRWFWYWWYVVMRIFTSDHPSHYVLQSGSIVGATVRRCKVSTHTFFLHGYLRMSHLGESLAEVWSSRCFQVAHIADQSRSERACGWYTRGLSSLALTFTVYIYSSFAQPNFNTLTPFTHNIAIARKTFAHLTKPNTPPVEHVTQATCLLGSIQAQCPCPTN